MYGSYSVMHLQKNTIIDIQLVQVSVKYTRMTVLPVTVTLVDGVYGEGGVVLRSLQREKDSGDGGK